MACTAAGCECGDNMSFEWCDDLRERGAKNDAQCPRWEVRVYAPNTHNMHTQYAQYAHPQYAQYAHPSCYCAHHGVCVLHVCAYFVCVLLHVCIMFYVWLCVYVCVFVHVCVCVCVCAGLCIDESPHPAVVPWWRCTFQL